MWDCDCGAVPVIDDDGRAIAVVTDRDICMAALMRDRAPSAIPVAEAMSRDLKSCGPDDEVATAEEIMRAHQIRRLPIVDRDRRPVGMLSLADPAGRSIASAISSRQSTSSRATPRPSSLSRAEPGQALEQAFRRSRSSVDSSSARHSSSAHSSRPWLRAAARERSPSARSRRRRRGVLELLRGQRAAVPAGEALGALELTPSTRRTSDS